ncbi:MAG: DUF2953 domain-containing protein [Lachnospiraceae bacterium]|nr:DUF2953 domain-containing protein [Lachnospiraceae bacterium]
MLHIILLILKIIGIILLVILGILLLSVLGALFVPVRYRIRLHREGGEDKPPFTVYVKITWLLHFLNILIRYPSDVMVRVRLMIFTLFRIPEKEAKAVHDKKSVKKTETKRKEEGNSKGKQEQVKQETIKTEQEKQVKEKQQEREQQTEVYEAFASDFMQMEDVAQTASEEETTKESEQTQEIHNTKKKFSLMAKIRELIDKIKQFIEKIKAFFENIQYTIRKFCDKIKSTLDNIQYYREVLESEPFKQSFNLCKGELGAVFNSIKPDRFEADLTIGMEDPATTGQIFAVYGMLYPLIGQNVRITGDFESERTRVEGQIYIRGKIRAFTFLKAAIKIYFNKDIKKLIKLLKKEAV